MNPRKIVSGQILIALVSTALWIGSANAGVIFGAGNSLNGGSRWDAAAKNIAGVGERSLNGGLRYSLQGSSFQAYRDLFSWDVLPTVGVFQTGVQQAFDMWNQVDPASGLGSDLSFVADLGTPVVGMNNGNGGLDTRGAEIDLFGSTDAGFWNVGNTGTQGETKFGTVNDTVTLTSGTANYAGSFAISGADIILNSNAGAIYSIDFFVRLLAHEIGHAIGLGDVEGDINPNRFIDDNYDGTNSATALATLTNSWAATVNALNPAASVLSVFNVPDADPGVDTPGVNILMESRSLGIAAGNPVGNPSPLSNDDYGTRQFLYPFVARPVPEPGVLSLLLIGFAALKLVRIRRA